MNSLLGSYDTGTCRRTSINVIRNLNARFVNNWHHALENSSKLDFYRKCKQNFAREKYLQIENFTHRREITRLRISAHKLNVEQDRYRTPPIPRDQRFCTFCRKVLALNNIEDECHLLDECQLYTSARTLFCRYTNKEPSDVFINSSNLDELTRLGRFISNSMDLHTAFKNYLDVLPTDGPSLLNRCTLL